MLERLVTGLSQRALHRSPESDRPQAAVALMLAPVPDQLLLIRRAERAGDPWSGHLALPGGRRGIGDADLLATAIRETEEETGVRLEREWCRAELDDLVPQTLTLPPIMVRPFVFLLTEAIPPGVSNEVVQAAWLPLANLVAKGVRGARAIEIRGQSRVVEGYRLPEGFLWGMTERIITPILEAWQSPD